MKDKNVQKQLLFHRAGSLFLGARNLLMTLGAFVAGGEQTTQAGVDDCQHSGLEIIDINMDIW